LPDMEEQIRQLPGIGEYTAAAVLSIAFARPIGVVDGNVLRVVPRLLADSGLADRSPADRSRESLKKRVRLFVEASFVDYHPGWINQAWMELGALVAAPSARSDTPAGLIGKTGPKSFHRGNLPELFLFARRACLYSFPPLFRKRSWRVYPL
jgi:hypothetical protein